MISFFMHSHYFYFDQQPWQKEKERIGSLTF